MIKLYAALATAEDETDVNIAYGEASHRRLRMKNAALVVLIGACMLLTVGYVEMHRQVRTLDTQLDSVQSLLVEHNVDAEAHGANGGPTR